MGRAYAVAILLVTVSVLGIVMGTWDISEQIVEAFPALKPFVQYIHFAFLAALIIASLTLFYIIYSHLREVVGKARDGELPMFNRGQQHFCCEDLKSEDLPAVEEIYRATTPGQTDLETSRRLYNRCRKGWKKIIDLRTMKIAGYFVVLPLTQRGINAIESRSFSLSDNASSAYFRQNFAKNCAIYIGMIGADPNIKSAKIASLSQLKEFVNAKAYSAAYAKAATKDGLRLLKRRNFQTVFNEDASELGVFFVKRLDD